MEEASEHRQAAPAPPQLLTAADGTPSSSSSSSVRVYEGEEDVADARLGQRQNEEHHHDRRHDQPSGVSYRLNISISDAASTELRDDLCSCLLVLVSFWFFAASMTLILGFYGSVNLNLGPSCSRLIQVNPFFVQSIKVEELDKPKHGPMLYGFHELPPLDVETTWLETHTASIFPSFHEEWIYFLNRWSKVHISYNVEPSSSAPLSIVIAQGRESLVEWIEDPSYPNTTLSWNIIYGSGQIEQQIFEPSIYYIAVGNLNSEEVQVHLNFTIKSFIYNTTQAWYKCSLSQHLCRVKLSFLKRSTAVLTSPVQEQLLQFPQGTEVNDWYVKLSYGPRWISYFVGSGVMTVIILLVFRLCNMFQPVSRDGTGVNTRVLVSERVPLLSQKDDDLLSWGSSYDSVSHDEEDLEEWLAVAPLEGKPLKEGENSNNNPRRVCIICFDAPRDCFFLPCGHCAACFACGTRIAEEAGTCPVCRRKMRKVRKIFTV